LRHVPSCARSRWRSLSQLEVDFVVTGPERAPVGIEVKAKRSAARRDTKGLRALGEDMPGLRWVVVCLEPHRRVDEDGVEVVPLEAFLSDLWRGRLLA
jgi:predicted AAA+ superfamily ATPase